MDLNAFKTDKNLLDNGAWVDEILPGVDMKICSPTSSVFKAYSQKLIRPFQQLNKEPSTEEAEEIAAKCFANIGVKDWRSRGEGQAESVPFIVYDGEEMKFTPENAYRIFMEVPVILEVVATASKSLANYKLARDETTGKN